MNSIKEFRDENGNVLAHGAIADRYTIGGSLIDGFQHESVPFFITAHAVDTERNVMMYALSDEMYTTYKNRMMTQALNSMQDVRWNSIRDFIEPEIFMLQFAQALSMMQLSFVGESHLPSVLGSNPERTYNDFMTEYNAAFEREASLGTPVKANNILLRSFMRKYTGYSKTGVRCSVFAGMDYNGIEYYAAISPLSAINPLAGLFGTMSRSRKAENSSKKLGEGEPCDCIDWGAKYKFLLICPEEFEQEVFPDFMELVRTFHMDNALRQRFYNLKAQRIQMRMQESMMFQSMAISSMQALQASQQRLAQTLASNSAAMSDMIMDSWNKKMASDSRISAARSDAIMGVNHYTNSYGHTYDVSVSADHVYQNQYGDVYGVSGNAFDQELLNKLNWKELDK